MRYNRGIKKGSNTYEKIYQHKHKEVKMSFCDQVATLTVGDAIKLNKLTLMCEGLGANGKRRNSSVCNTKFNKTRQEVKEVQMNDINEQAWSDYHDDFINRKTEILTKLNKMRKSRLPLIYDLWIGQAIEFIKEQRG